MLLIYIILIVLHGISSVRIEKNGYKEIMVSFSEKVSNESVDFEKLKEVLRNSSDLLFHATRRRSYFEEFILVVPSSWPDNSICEEFVSEAPRNIDVYVVDSSEIPVLRTQHSKECGQKGDIIYLPNNWLVGDTEDLALQFVQKWSTFRYGVFPEMPERKGSCFATSEYTWSPTGCFNIELREEAKFDESGLPICYLPNNISEDKNLASSIMSSVNSSKVLNFCDGSALFPHNPVIPTLHNRICQGKALWPIIKNTEDFRYGRNTPLTTTEQPNVTTFRCFRESTPQLTLAVQNSSSKLLSTEMTQIRYALSHFLSSMAAADSTVNLVTFADTASTDPVALNFQDRQDLDAVLELHLNQNAEVPTVCFTCGLQKAYEVSAVNKSPSQVVVLLAWESSLDQIKATEIVEIIESKPNIVLYLLLVEDRPTYVVPSAVEDAVQATNGRIFRTKEDPVSMIMYLNVALLTALENDLHIEDKYLLVYQKTYLNETSNIVDTFLIPKAAKGKLLYIMHCNTRGVIRIVNESCTDWDKESLTYKCGKETDLSDKTPLMWKHSYKRITSMMPITCSSLAMMKLEAPLTNTVTVRGWLSENKITPGLNTLKIYAEVIGIREKQNIQVEAKISGPGPKDFNLKLWDNGNGDPDIIKGDGIYSRYFTSFAQKGTYTVTIHVKYDANEENYAVPTEKANSENRLSQTKVIGTFEVTQKPPQDDILPPNRVADLKVISIDNENGTVLLQWTAPGDNYDEGNAKEYIVKLSNLWMSLLEVTFNDNSNVVLNTDGYVPASHGYLETLRFQCPLNSANATYYIALLAKDAHGNEAEVSNIIQIHFKDAQIPLYDNTTSSDISNGNITIASTETYNSTREVISASHETVTAVNENMTGVLNTENPEGIFIEKNTAIIAFSTSGVVVILLIVINIIICICCFRKKKQSEKPKKLSRKTSLRPPYNLNIAYKHGSLSSLDQEEETHNSMNMLTDHNRYYSASPGNGVPTEHRYIYHTSKSLSKASNKGMKNELGFKVVQPMSAYATSSLSRFASKHDEVEDKCEPSNGTTMTQTPKLSNSCDAEIYPLGTV